MLFTQEKYEQEIYIYKNTTNLKSQPWQCLVNGWGTAQYLQNSNYRNTLTNSDSCALIYFQILNLNKGLIWDQSLKH